MTCPAVTAEERFPESELESALAEYPGVAEAAVVVHGDEFDRQVVAYLVTGQRPCPDGAELRGYLAEAAPGADPPRVLVQIDRLPRGPAGTVDREALRGAVRGDGAETGAPLVLGGLAAEVADIWLEVLPVRAVGMSDDLFDLGGHSLSINRITGRVRSRLGVGLPLTVFYDTPTVPGIVAAIEDLRRP